MSTDAIRGHRPVANLIDREPDWTLWEAARVVFWTAVVLVGFWLLAIFILAVPAHADDGSGPARVDVSWLVWVLFAALLVWLFALFMATRPRR